MPEQQENARSLERHTPILPSMTSSQPLFNDSRDIPIEPAELAFVQQRLISFSKDPLAGTSAEFKVGVRSLPYLADHAFQDMIVLPGSLYVEMAFCVHGNLLKQAAGTLRDAIFQNPVILSEGDSTIRVMVKEQGDGNVEYMFYEVAGDDVTLEMGRQYCAKIEIESRRPTCRESHFKEFSIKDFTDHSSCVINRDEFYGALRANGNQYGPHFQRLDALWRVGDRVLGRLSVPRIKGQVGQHSLLPTLVDSIVQLQAAFIIEKGRTFVLGSITKSWSTRSIFRIRCGPLRRWLRSLRNAKRV